MRGAGWSRVTHPFATLCAPEGALTVRLACVRHAASVHPEPGSNSPLNAFARGRAPAPGLSETSPGPCLARASPVRPIHRVSVLKGRPRRHPAARPEVRKISLVRLPGSRPAGLTSAVLGIRFSRCPPSGRSRRRLARSGILRPFGPRVKGESGISPGIGPKRAPLPPDPTPRLHNPRLFVETRRGSGATGAQHIGKGGRN